MSFNKIPLIGNQHSDETRNIINLMVQVINNRGLEILSDSAFLNWLDKNNFKPKDAVDTFNDLPSNPEVNELRGVLDENAIYLYNGSKWVHQSNINFDGLEPLKDDVESRATKRVSFANATHNLQITNYLGNVQNTHPKVLYFAEKWNGWNYWMAYTPYPFSDTQTENPSIATSQDGLNWGVPEGLTNPLELAPEGGYHSDTHLVMVGNRMEIWWRSFFSSQNNREIFYRRTSTNGVSWTEKEVMLDSAVYGKGMLSPSILYEDGKYKLWGCGIDAGEIYYNESIDGKTWDISKERTLDIPNKNLRPWHLDLIKTDKGYEFVIQGFMRPSGALSNTSLWYIQSDDNINFTEPIEILKPSKTIGAFDDRSIYRSSPVKVGNEYVLYYAATSTEGRFAISFAKGDNLTELQGYKRTSGLERNAYVFDNEKGVRLPRTIIRSTGHGDYGTHLTASPDKRNVAKIYGTLRPHLTGGLELGIIYLDDANDIGGQNLPAVEGAVRRVSNRLQMHDGESWNVIGAVRKTIILNGGTTHEYLDIQDVGTILLRGTGDVVINGFSGGAIGSETRIVFDSPNVRGVINNANQHAKPGATELILDRDNVSCVVMRMLPARTRAF